MAGAECAREPEDRMGSRARARSRALKVSRNKLQMRSSSRYGRVVRQYGDVDAALKGASRVLEATYAYPFLPHNSLEPQGSTASFKDGKLEVWSTTQDPSAVRRLTAKITGVSESDVTIHLMRAGGAFGRRFTNDDDVEAAWLSKQAGQSGQHYLVA